MAECMAAQHACMHGRSDETHLDWPEAPQQLRAGCTGAGEQTRAGAGARCTDMMAACGGMSHKCSCHGAGDLGGSRSISPAQAAAVASAALLLLLCPACALARLCSAAAVSCFCSALARLCSAAAVPASCCSRLAVPKASLQSQHGLAEEQSCRGPSQACSQTASPPSAACPWTSTLPPQDLLLLLLCCCPSLSSSAPHSAPGTCPLLLACSQRILLRDIPTPPVYGS